MSGITIVNAKKQYGDVTALDDLNLCFAENKIYGLLGRNGAGKTTLLNSITGRSFLDSGSIELDGNRILENDAALSQLFMLSEMNCYPPTMTVRDAFKWSEVFYRDFDPEYANRIAGLFKLNTKKKCKTLSTGYMTIFKLIIALSTNAPYVLLDEPVLGLDANHRELFYKLLLEKYAEKPFCCVISTHLVEEISGIIENVVIIKNGQIIFDTTRDELLSQGYTVSGSAAKVDEYTAGKKLLGADSLGGLKTAYVLGRRADTLPEGLEITKLDLQRLFVQLTND